MCLREGLCVGASEARLDRRMFKPQSKDLSSRVLLVFFLRSTRRIHIPQASSSSPVQRVRARGSPAASDLKGQRGVCAVVSDTHMLARRRGSSPASLERRTLAIQPGVHKNTHCFTNFQLLFPPARAASFTRRSTKVLSEEQGQRGSRWKTHLTISR